MLIDGRSENLEAGSCAGVRQRVSAACVGVRKATIRISETKY
jgi:hypothetical protein